MRVFSTRFTLGLLIVGTVCATADTAQGIGRRRKACCVTYPVAVAYQPSGCCGGAVMGTPGYYQPNTGIVNPAAFVAPAAVPSILPVRATETKVRITDGTFEPATVSITAGSTVRWTNDGRQPHSVTSSKGDWGSADITPGQDFTATFTQPGTFEYYCKFHKDAKEMKGTIVVK